jgi:hypothetical protein
VPEVKVTKDGDNFFVEVDGVRIAQRGFPNSPQAGTWVSIEPGWEVVGTKTQTQSLSDITGLTCIEPRFSSHLGYDDRPDGI